MLKRTKPIVRTEWKRTPKEEKVSRDRSNKTRQRRKRLMMEYADNVWSLVVRARANGKCELCGSPATQAHHCLPKARGNSLRYMVENGVAICDSCHDHGNRFLLSNCIHMLTQNRPDDADKLRAWRHEDMKFTLTSLQDIRDSLKAKLQEMGP